MKNEYWGLFNPIFKKSCQSNKVENFKIRHKIFRYKYIHSRFTCTVLNKCVAMHQYQYQIQIQIQIQAQT